ncbi:Hypothetical_protein [Hexamita inflata]|uniref:Hypothetical_protein n=1 Tax=Hexamita inflata TaxID=28002 RepID=A0AA86QHA7_9EUKA|nr:Hypothetical protein HINF_LOCUS45898 [Hexamita inflata]CAI9958256.1 Hypothetical protein HINF_LOCUS45901 [Hexamita inflata]
MSNQLSNCNDESIEYVQLKALSYIEDPIIYIDDDNITTYISPKFKKSQAIQSSNSAVQDAEKVQSLRDLSFRVARPDFQSADNSFIITQTEFDLFDLDK